MNINRNYIIMQPFQLPWRFVSPFNYKGLEYHLSPDLSIRLEGLFSTTVKLNEKKEVIEGIQEEQFLIGQEILLDEQFEFSAIDGEAIFNNQVLVRKSQERIKKTFSDKTNATSCFFTERQMGFFHDVFETNFYICSKITVAYKGKEIEDIAELPPKEFKMALNAFSELNVQATLDYKKSKAELEEEYTQFFEKKVAAEEEKERKTLWDKVRNKESRKDVLRAFGTVAIGIGGLVIRKRLAAKSGWLTGIGAVVVGILGLGFELYGRQQANTLMRTL